MPKAVNMSLDTSVLIAGNALPARAVAWFGPCSQRVGGGWRAPLLQGLQGVAAAGRHPPLTSSLDVHIFDSASRSRSKALRLFLPLPLAGEGWGEGVPKGRSASLPPHPHPLPQGGEGVKTGAPSFDSASRNHSKALRLFFPLPLEGEGWGEGVPKGCSASLGALLWQAFSPRCSFARSMGSGVLSLATGGGI